jgi:hypothetical protein
MRATDADGGLISIEIGQSDFAHHDVRWLPSRRGERPLATIDDFNLMAIDWSSAESGTAASRLSWTTRTRLSRGAALPGSERVTLEVYKDPA